MVPLARAFARSAAARRVASRLLRVRVVIAAPFAPCGPSAA
jgi:hypothetical protein